MPDTPLNPDALEAASRTVHPGYWKLIDKYPEESITQKSKSNLIEEARSTVSAYLAVAQPVAQKLTDAEWQAFQAIPDQGYSHRAWVDARIAERVAVAQPEVNSVEELDALPEGTVLLVTDKRPGVGKSSWELFSDVLELRSSDGELEPKAWASPAYTTEYTCKSLWEIADQINVLYRPEVKP